MHRRERVGLKQQNTFSPLGTDINKQGRKRNLYKVTEPLPKRRATQLNREYMWNGLAVLGSYNFREFDIMASLTFFGALNALSTNVLTMKLRVDNNNHNLSVTNND